MSDNVPWPTFEQYMSLEDSSHRSHQELMALWRKKARRSVGYIETGNSGVYGYETMVGQVADITGRQRKPAPTAVENSIPSGLTRSAQQLEEINALIDQTLVDIERGSFRRPAVKPGRTQFVKGLTATREPVEPKGPIALRLHLWWMRIRLRWMLLRLDDVPIGINKTLREYA